MMKMWFCLHLLLIITALVIPFASARCDRTPESNPYPKTISDGRFQIQISGNPETYVPGEQYTVFLRGTVNTLEQHKFKDFLLVIEQENADQLRAISQRPSIGYFTLLGDALTKFNDVCPNAVSQTNSLPKTEIQVFWKAPEPGSGCVAFRSTIVEQRDLWYMDDGELTKVLCEEITESDDMQPAILTRCGACDEAKYEVTFEGLWSRNTHPKDFPSNGWLTRFSDVIGASHTKNYTFWNYGEYASEGLRQVAENGNTRMLESELKGKSDHIRTIIKARGISYPNVTGKTFAVFRVDNQHHLMSLVSMIDPSPDWFVGVSSLELCLRNGSWIESKILNLYPWDAGTDEGWTYISPDQPSTPRGSIRRIKSNSPNDPRSPFYDPTGTEMKPLARLYLSRQRLYEKPCDSINFDPTESGEECEVSEWSEWSPCSATCGRGTKYRQRKYLKEASRSLCTKHLTSRANCKGPQRVCPDHNEDRFNDPKCALTDWSEWSTCSVTCGRGSRTRDRRYLTRNATKHCSLGLSNPPKLKDTEVCYGHYGACEGEEWNPTSNENYDCPTRPWSDWSPCSVSCGKGYKKRTRDPVQAETFYDDATDEAADSNADNEEEDPCEDERYEEIVGCQAEIPSCDISPASAEVTQDPFYDFESGRSLVDAQFDSVGPVVDCKTTRWSRWTPCNTTKACGRGTKQKHREIITHPRNGGEPCPKKLYKIKKCKIACDNDDRSRNNDDRSRNNDDRSRNNDNNADDLDPSWGSPSVSNEINVDCKMSKWSPWSPCSQSCGPLSVQQRTRTIHRHARGSGRPCMSRVETQPCENVVPCPYS